MRTCDTAIIRALDANANRGREGLRVLEDIARFVLNDVFLADMAKGLRHRLEEILGAIPSHQRLASRNTLGDVGTSLSTEQENRRPDVVTLTVANSRRVEEALRSLEEFSKVIGATASVQLKDLRYQAYTLEKSLVNAFISRSRLESVRLYVLIGAGESEQGFCAFARALVDAGVDALQLRVKGVSDRLFLNRAKLLRKLTTGTKTLCLINDRADIAAVVDADGVHLGQEDLPAEEARRLLGPEKLIGISTHDLSQAEQAVVAGANYIGVGPVFPTKTKHFDFFPGLDFAREVAARLSIPAFAIGGITLQNLPAVLATGISRVAVSSAVAEAQDPVAAVRQFRAMLDSSAQHSSPSMSG